MVAGAIVATSCGSTAPPAGARSGVVAAFYPVAEAARQVAGGRIPVADLTPAGAEPHDLEVTAEQVDRIEDAAVVVVLGGGFQPSVEQAARQHAHRNVELLDRLGAKTRARAERDPHVWLDPVLMRELVPTIRDAIIRADPGHEAEYARNATRYEARLDGLDREFERGLASCRRRTIVTAHDAFGWLARRYRLTQRGIAGVSPEQEPDAARLGELADLVRRDGLTTVFTERLVSPRVARTLAREAGVRTETLDPLETLRDASRRDGEDYVTVMRANLRKLRAALGCR